MLAIPLVAAIMLFQLAWKKKKWAQLADPHLRKSLVVQYQPKRIRAARLLTLIGIALLAAAMLNPQQPDADESGAISGLEIILAIDVSNSMLATDATPNRLERSKHLARQLLDTLQGSKIGIVAFAGEAWLQLPLSSDIAAARLLLSSVQTQSVPTQGTNLALALQTANDHLPATDKAHKAIVLFTDGEALEGDTEAAAQQLKEAGVMVIAVGVGTPQGATISDEIGTPLLQEDGSQVVSRLQEEGLRSITTSTQGSYVALYQNKEAAKTVIKALNALPKKPLMNSNLVNFQSFSYALIAMALVLLVGAMAITISKKSPNRPLVKIVPLLLCWLFLFGETHAQAVDTETIKANALLQQGKFDEAAAAYKTLIAKNGQNWNARLHLGNIAYKRGQYAEAVAQYEATLQNPMPEAALLAALNNKALALVKMNKLPEAIETFKKAVRQNPYDTGLQNNLSQALDEYAKARQSDQPPPPSSKPMNKKKAEDRLAALQQEEQKIRQQLMKQKSAPNKNGKYW